MVYKIDQENRDKKIVITIPQDPNENLYPSINLPLTKPRYFMKQPVQQSPRMLWYTCTYAEEGEGYR